MLYWVHLATNGIQTHNFSLVVIGTDCTGNSKSNFHKIMTNPAPFYLGPGMQIHIGASRVPLILSYFGQKGFL